MDNKQQIPVITRGKDNRLQHLPVLEVWAGDASQTLSPGEINTAFVADHFKVTVDSLYQANNLQRDAVLMPGETIRVILPEGS